MVRRNSVIRGRETRLSEALEGSADAEEALLKRCARPASAPNTIMNGSSGDGSDVTACSNVVSKRAAAAGIVQLKLSGRLLQHIALRRRFGVGLQ